MQLSDDFKSEHCPKWQTMILKRHVYLIQGEGICPLPDLIPLYPWAFN